MVCVNKSCLCLSFDSHRLLSEDIDDRQGLKRLDLIGDGMDRQIEDEPRLVCNSSSVESHDSTFLAITCRVVLSRNVFHN